MSFFKLAHFLMFLSEIYFTCIYDVSIVDRFSTSTSKLYRVLTVFQFTDYMIYSKIIITLFPARWTFQPYFFVECSGSPHIIPFGLTFINVIRLTYVFGVTFICTQKKSTNSSADICGNPSRSISDLGLPSR